MRTVLERASASFPLQTKHQSAFKSINSINDLVSYTNSKHIDMASAITSSSSGNLLRREIGQYFFSFMGRKHADCDTAAAATVIHSCQCRSDLNLLMRQAIIAGADMHTDALEEAADNAAATGEITSHSSTSQSLADMPPHQWIGLLRLGTEAACFDSNKQLSFESQRSDWQNMDLSQFTTSAQALACELFHYDACVGVFGGKFGSDYDRFLTMKRALEKQLPTVVEELNDMIIDGIDTDTLSMNWHELKALIQKAFTRASRRGNVKPSAPQSEPLQTFHAGKQSDPHTETGASGYVDKKISCIRQLPTGTVCSNQFIHSVADQMEYNRLGFPNDPKGCPDCRRRIREEQGTSRGRLCNEFTRTGKCSKADKCTFSHSEPPAEPAQSNEMVPYNPSVNFTAVEMDSDGSDDIDPDCY